VNHLRKAAQGGATVRRVFQRDRETGKELPQRVNPMRRMKRELGLSGRQIKKLRKAALREDKATRVRAIATPAR
jgi:hypothetical protein